MILEREDLNASVNNGSNAIVYPVFCENRVSTPSIPKKSWFVLRVAYNQEDKASCYLSSHGLYVFCPKVSRVHLNHGKRITCMESLLPNILFVYATFDELKEYVYDNVHDETKYLRFYLIHRHSNDSTAEPAVISEKDMQKFMLICSQSESDIRILPDTVTKFQTGQLVRIISGPFKSIEGRVARWHGQNRVAVKINNLFTIVTAYIPGAFLEAI